MFEFVILTIHSDTMQQIARSHLWRYCNASKQQVRRQLSADSNN